jgi:uroporphyrinogen decarboxylase
MTGRERIMIAVRHQEPDRVPLDVGGTNVSGIHRVAYENLVSYLHLPVGDIRIADIGQDLAFIDEKLLARLGVDTRGIMPCDDVNWQVQLRDRGESQSYDDIWGIRWERRKSPGAYFQIGSHPLRGLDPQRLRSYAWPNPRDEKRVAMLKEKAIALAASGAAVVLGTPGMSVGLFQEFQWLLGYTESLCELAEDSALARLVISSIARRDIEFWEWALPLLGNVIDIVTYTDDFGLQEGPMISAAMFRKHFKPWYREIVTSIKKTNPGVKVFFHTCGSSRFILEDLIEIGVDIVNPVQFSARDMDRKALKRDFGTSLTFWGGGIDSQSDLPRGDDQQIRDAVHRAIDELAPGGGYVFSTVHNIQPDVPPQNLMTMWCALADFGKYGGGL